jgi:hypothetical protein
MSNAVKNFLIGLGEHPRARMAFADDPALATAGLGLADADRKILATGDASAIYDAAGAADGADAPKIISFPGGLI